MNINICLCVCLLGLVDSCKFLLMSKSAGFILCFEIYYAVYLLWLGSCQIKKQALSPLVKEFLQDHWSMYWSLKVYFSHHIIVSRQLCHNKKLYQFFKPYCWENTLLQRMAVHFHLWEVIPCPKLLSECLNAGLSSCWKSGVSCFITLLIFQIPPDSTLFQPSSLSL